jgi:hypothetical protein
LKRRHEIDSITAKADLGKKRLPIRNLKREKKKEKDLTKKSQITMNVKLADKAMANLDEDLKTNEDLFNNAGTEISKCKKYLAEMEKAHGTTRESLANGVECIFKKIGASKEAYHGGEYNGKSIL